MLPSTGHREQSTGLSGLLYRADRKDRPKRTHFLTVIAFTEIYGIVTAGTFFGFN
jgi:hypothetical protein